MGIIWQKLRELKNNKWRKNKWETETRLDKDRDEKGWRKVKADRN